MSVLFAITTFLLIFAAAYGFIKAGEEFLPDEGAVYNVFVGSVLFLLVAGVWVISTSNVITISR